VALLFFPNVKAVEAEEVDLYNILYEPVEAPELLCHMAGYSMWVRGGGN